MGARTGHPVEMELLFRNIICWGDLYITLLGDGHCDDHHSRNQHYSYSLPGKHVIPSFWVSLEMVKLMKNHVKPRFWMVQPFNRSTVQPFNRSTSMISMSISSFGYKASAMRSPIDKPKESQRVSDSLRECLSPKRPRLLKSVEILGAGCVFSKPHEFWNRIVWWPSN